MSSSCRKQKLVSLLKKNGRDDSELNCVTMNEGGWYFVTEAGTMSCRHDLPKEAGLQEDRAKYPRWNYNTPEEAAASYLLARSNRWKGHYT